jgi:hypothetical protein
MNTTLTREEILQSGIHHRMAALDYSRWGWEACGGLVYQLVFLQVFNTCCSSCNSIFTPIDFLCAFRSYCLPFARVQFLYFSAYTLCTPA